ncbi:hypothetical protein BVI434_340024 [Burkholderia vietnamiensis]|nr:hypothetical protein BVI434_340024 [Burkholderia vietnamiensis]
MAERRTAELRLPASVHGSRWTPREAGGPTVPTQASQATRRSADRVMNHTLSNVAREFRAESTVNPLVFDGKMPML